MLPSAVLSSSTPPQQKAGARRDSFTCLQGIRMLMAALIVQSHCGHGLFGLKSRFQGWPCVNMFFALSGWLAYTSLCRSWDAQRSLLCSDLPESGNSSDPKYKKMPTSQIRLLTSHCLEYQLRRVLPLIWSVTLLVIVLSFLPTFSSFISLAKHVFHPLFNPATNFWTIHLRSTQTGDRIFQPDPPLWFMACLTLYALITPFLFYLIKALLRSMSQIKVVLRDSIFMSAPFALMLIDYWYVRSRLDKHYKDVPGPHPNVHQFALAVSPEGYVMKYFIPMLACGFWNALPWWDAIGMRLKLIPLLDILIAVQTLIYCLVPFHDRHIFWMCKYISMYLPVNCLIILTVTHNLGSRCIIGRFLSSRWMCRLAPHSMTLFIYIIHFPLMDFINHRIRSKRGQTMGLTILFFVALHATHAHDALVVRYNAILARIFKHSNCES
eukprot:Gregarina_sp_Poly_1__7271@NODE_39_length_18147_cov_101_572069_g34_i0_p5_GENE_NODE_39_length_18147_cov_101_572069_g34_i0NODE_39_length_18147_cov_101_572069_g34_i0_p5_ORF_typecomplete_len438_score20_62Acyl_transf_3/PF01757_22/1_3e18DUF1700/PF08006_11/0_61_NODE_39_length_18147_cov_101_572069_g34_i0968410997